MKMGCRGGLSPLLAQRRESKWDIPFKCRCASAQMPGGLKKHSFTLLIVGPLAVKELQIDRKLAIGI
jgi:hypothetical protein